VTAFSRARVRTNLSSPVTMEVIARRSHSRSASFVGPGIESPTVRNRFSLPCRPRYQIVQAHLNALVNGKLGESRGRKATRLPRVVPATPVEPSTQLN
jgi:hypothetical protein